MCNKLFRFMRPSYIADKEVLGLRSRRRAGMGGDQRDPYQVALKSILDLRAPLLQRAEEAGLWAMAG